jgi:hypothetical protein
MVTGVVLVAVVVLAVIVILVACWPLILTKVDGIDVDARKFTSPE